MKVDGNEYNDTPEAGSDFAPTPRGVTAEKAKDIRESHAYKRAKKDFRDRGSVQRNSDGLTGAPCWLCNEKIWWRLAWPHPLSWSLDHALTVKERPDLVDDVGNWRHSHWGCNQARGTDDPAIDLGVPSEEWPPDVESVVDLDYV